jgi:hypothetical protein
MYLEAIDWSIDRKSKFRLKDGYERPKGMKEARTRREKIEISFVGTFTFSHSPGYQVHFVDFL